LEKRIVERAVFQGESDLCRSPQIHKTTDFITKDKKKIFQMRILFMLATESLLRCYKTQRIYGKIASGERIEILNIIYLL